MPCMGFEPTIPASERAKTVHAIDLSATVTGEYLIGYTYSSNVFNLEFAFLRGLLVYLLETRLNSLVSCVLWSRNDNYYYQEGRHRAWSLSIEASLVGPGLAISTVKRWCFDPCVHSCFKTHGRLWLHPASGPISSRRRIDAKWGT
jgi:hypothetical protein